MLSDVELPEPDPEARQLSAQLSETIRSRCAQAGGCIGFDEFMRMALYEPALGYYVNGATIFGSAGDYVTAPELSPLFGAAVANHCGEILERLPEGLIVEFGGGSGRLAGAVLTRLRELGHEPQAYHIVELSPELRRRQRETIAAMAPQSLDRVAWLDTTPRQPVDGVIIANEVLDAIPFNCFRLQEGEVFERRVGIGADGRFEWQLRNASAQVGDLVREYQAQGYFAGSAAFDFEICGAFDIWVSELGSILRSGAALIGDYGSARSELYGAQHDQGTLRCYFQHLLHSDPFRYPGLQDITASVDFTRVAEAAVEHGLAVAGYTEQAQFLLGCGVLELLSSLQSQLDDGERLTVNEKLKTLLLPNKMGTRFKMMCLTRNYDHPLLGFAAGDRRYAL